MLSKLMERGLYCDVQDMRQCIGKISARGMIDEPFGGGQQGAETREPEVLLRPQALVVKESDFAQRIISAATVVAGEVIQRNYLAEYGEIERGAQECLQFFHRGTL